MHVSTTNGNKNTISYNHLLIHDFIQITNEKLIHYNQIRTRLMCHSLIQSSNSIAALELKGKKTTMKQMKTQYVESSASNKKL